MLRSTRRRLNQRMRDSNVHDTGPMIVTCWYRDRGDGLKYNHYSHGFHPDHEEPAPMFESQQVAWSGGIWVGKEACLEDGVVTECS